MQRLAERHALVGLFQTIRPRRGEPAIEKSVHGKLDLASREATWKPTTGWPTLLPWNVIDLYTGFGMLLLQPT